MTNCTIWYIHGAGASERSFAWLAGHFNQPAQMLTHEMEEPLSKIIARHDGLISQAGLPSIVVGHSLGGLVALGLHDNPHVKAVVTLCAPFGGLASAGVMCMFSNSTLFQDLTTFSPILTKLRATKINKPMLSVVATTGLPFTREVNDGVVTQKSASIITGPSYVTIPVNHFEVLMSAEVVDEITQFISKVAL